MKKITVSSATFILITCFNLTTPANAGNTINYAPFTVPARYDLTVDLAKGSPEGLRPNVLYKMVCTTSARDDVEITFDTNDSILWSELKMNGSYLPTKFNLPANTTISFVYTINKFGDKTTLKILNGSHWYHQVDVTFNCEATSR